ncbi:MAG TPA: hypothetical protein PKK26_14905, partial [Candidatus Wallbacteria bacterium]|nr:hypothetical protein [Candidatus Wallbacteria bacterium]
MKKISAKNPVVNVLIKTFPVIAVILALTAAVSIAAQGTLCEGLWKEFVENKPDEAKIIYKNVVEAAKGKDAGEKEISLKATRRLEALGEKKDGEQTAGAHKFIVSTNLQALLFSLLVSKGSNEQLYEKTRESLTLLFSDFIKENLNKYKLPQVILVNFSGEIKPEDTDIIIRFEEDATFKKDSNTMAGALSGYNGFNLNWKTLLFTCKKNEEEITQRYK